MIHWFDVEVATRYGIVEALLLAHIHFWVNKNEANEKHFHEGHYWTYNSRKALQTIFPYVSDKTISRALKHLVEEGLVIEGKFNTSPYDKTLWYALTNLGYSIGQNSNIDWTNQQHRLDKMTNRSGQNDQPIPDNIPDNKTHINNTDIYGEAQSRFIPPSVEEVRAYCNSRKNGIDAEQFVAYYASVNWMIGKQKMKNWRACVVTWERKRRKADSAAEDEFADFLKGEH